MSERTFYCNLCDKDFTGYGNNSQPIIKGECCNECNYEIVIPVRIWLSEFPPEDREKILREKLRKFYFKKKYY